MHIRYDLLKLQTSQSQGETRSLKVRLLKKDNSAASGGEVWPPDHSHGRYHIIQANVSRVTNVLEHYAFRSLKISVLVEFHYQRHNTIVRPRRDHGRAELYRRNSIPEVVRYHVYIGIEPGIQGYIPTDEVRVFIEYRLGIRRCVKPRPPVYL